MGKGSQLWWAGHISKTEDHPLPKNMLYVNYPLAIRTEEVLIKTSEEVPQRLPHWTPPEVYPSCWPRGLAIDHPSVYHLFRKHPQGQLWGQKKNEEEPWGFSTKPRPSPAAAMAGLACLAMASSAAHKDLTLYTSLFAKQNHDDRQWLATPSSHTFPSSSHL